MGVLSHSSWVHLGLCLDLSALPWLAAWWLANGLAFLVFSWCSSVLFEPFFEKGARLQGEGFVFMWWKKNVGWRPPPPKIGVGHSVFMGQTERAPSVLYPKKVKAPCGRNLFE